ncbi:MAG TPA: hypothetical protein ENK90_02215, partial [Epsilonproteobacteria bacterium]|nr:hypothetical protein [Campylobacterota bacterium]
MTTEEIKEELLKITRNAFEEASTLQDTQRIEVYLLDGIPTTSDVLEENDTLIYGANRILCYQIYGYDYLEDEIKTWIDYARVIPQPTDDDSAMIAAESWLDFSSLSAPTERYLSAIRNAVTYLDATGRPVLVRMLFG